ncbi:MAG TPA: NUDIX domain-containing protein [Polyangiaceae bacterium]|nr:NUDIX domain-containing protein [Polyangiaceae bacterium]
MAGAGKHSAGLLVYRGSGPTLEVLLVHPGGPFWAKKDDGAWFIPKGEIEPGEDALAAARREFNEELGIAPPAGEPLELGSVKNKGGKLIDAWAIAGDLDLSDFKSNLFSMEWPPRSGKQREFPEVDRAQYFGIEGATQKMHPAEQPLLQRLLERLLKA